MSEQPKISIIISVYNVKKCLRRCSLDNSGRILDEYAPKDDRFVVIHQNQGQSVAPNMGMENANPPLPRNPFIAY